MKYLAAREDLISGKVSVYNNEGALLADNLPRNMVDSLIHQCKTFGGDYYRKDLRTHSIYTFLGVDQELYRLECDPEPDLCDRCGKPVSMYWVIDGELCCEACL